ncbi:MAG: aspartate aminotransferase family protein [Phycisphaerae bacterium]|nr:aspartate aminotransferase family protein [Phycisphaerae bacterium]MBM92311.1 aspartate aminotransferase family protein [Phycisphaerae bacterium]
MIDITEGDQNLSTEREGWTSDQPTNALIERDSALYYHQILSTPCLDEIINAEGPYITTRSGRTLLDFHGNSVHQLGFSHPAVIEAIETQMRSLPYCTRRYTNSPAVELATRLVACAPGELRDHARVLLTPSGSAAVGIALKIARACTGRHKTIAFHDSFHGATLDAASLSGQDLFHRGMGPMLPGVHHVDPPGGLMSAEADIEASVEPIEALLDQHDFAAVIAEPIRATTVRVAPAAFWQRVRAACDRNGTLLIFDEIPTGLGRSGMLWASEHTGVTPDLMVIGKGLGGGIFPQAAVVGRAELNDLGPTPVRELALGHYTHEKSPVGSAAALAVLDTLEHEGLVERSSALGQAWRASYAPRLSALPGVVDVRQVGLMLAVELTDPAHADRVMYESLRQGLSFKVGGGTCLILFPPLNVETALLDRATEILIGAIERAADAT